MSLVGNPCFCPKERPQRWEHGAEEERRQGRETGERWVSCCGLCCCVVFVFSYEVSFWKNRPFRAAFRPCFMCFSVKVQLKPGGAAFGGRIFGAVSGPGPSPGSAFLGAKLTLACQLCVPPPELRRRKPQTAKFAGKMSRRLAAAPPPPPDTLFTETASFSDQLCGRCWSWKFALLKLDGSAVCGNSRG